MNSKEMRESAEELRGQVEDVKDNAKETMQEFQEKARRWKTEASAKARRAASLADGYLHENAWTSVLVIAAAGCLIGYLLGRRED